MLTSINQIDVKASKYRSQNDNFEIAWARANRNPKRMVIRIFGGINSLGL